MKISIIIATYNAGKTLHKCIDSIIPQLNEECELIVIDGESKDETISIIHSYEDKIAYTLSEADNGVYDAWNKGIDKAKGEWIMFIGADDCLFFNALNNYLSVIRNTPNINDYDYICAHNELIDSDDNILKVLGQNPVWNNMRRAMVAAHVASLHNKKNLFESIGKYNLKYHICADYELLLRKKDNLKSLYLDFHIAKMMVGGMSMSIKAIKETYLIRKEHHTVSPLINFLLYWRDVLAFNLFNLFHKY